ncbi:MAG: TRAP transporter large permease [Chloroflexi bacterium]|nr:TRAP transporter large permease [Chloroflexota bacterium]
MEAIVAMLLIFLVLIFIGVPVAFGFFLSAAVYVYVLADHLPDTIIAARGITFVAESYTILAVPLFVLAARLMNDAGMTDRLVRFALAAIGHVRGGIGHAVVVSNMIMAGMSGSATADAAGIGQAMIPALRKAGYSAPSAAALTASAATIGPIIPPSVAMVLYAALSNVSLGRLLLGGLVPGLMMGGFLMGGLLLSKEAAGLKRTRFDLRVLLSTIKDAFFSILMPVIILGGMFLGIYTPTEGAAVAVAYGILIGTLVYRTLDHRKLWKSMQATAAITGTVLLVVMGANAVSWILTAEGAGNILRPLFIPFESNPGLTLVVIAGVTLLLGTAIEEVTMLVLMTPILAPVVAGLGIDPVHFGIVFVLATMIGLITPPVGISMFITCQIAGVTTGQFTRAVIRPFIALLVVVVVISLVPDLVLWLPNAVLGDL